MALIKCVECGKEVSTQAKACPGCGAKAFKPKKPTSKLLIGLAVLVGAGLVAQCTVSDNERREAEHQDRARLDAMTPERRAAELKRRDDAKATEAKRAADEQAKKDAQDKAWRLQVAARSLCEAWFEKTANDPESVKWADDERQFEFTKSDASAARVTLGVRAKNGYGGLVHGTIRCTLARKGDDWELLTAKQLRQE